MVAVKLTDPLADSQRLRSPMVLRKDISPEQLAKLFYESRQTLAPEFGFQSGEGCFPWEEILPRQRELMVATARLVLRRLESRERDRSGLLPAQIA
jgi:hypothetical protein